MNTYLNVWKQTLVLPAINVFVKDQNEKKVQLDKERNNTHMARPQTPKRARDGKQTPNQNSNHWKNDENVEVSCIVLFCIVLYIYFLPYFLFVFAGFHFIKFPSVSCRQQFPVRKICLNHTVHCLHRFVSLSVCLNQAPAIIH